MSSRPAAWRLYAVAQACAGGAKTCNELSAVLGVSKARIQTALEHLHRESYLTRVRRVKSGRTGTVYYEYSVAKMPPFAAPPEGTWQARELQANTWGRNPLRPLMDALGWRESVPTGTLSRTHSIDN